MIPSTSALQVQSSARKGYTDTMTPKKKAADTISTPDVAAQFEAALAAETKVPTSALNPEAQEIAELMAPRKPEAKPDISRLPDAIEGGKLLLKPGERIVIERRVPFLAGCPYLDTRTYLINSIDEAKGVLRLWDEAFQQWAMDNYVKGPSYGQVYKMALGRSVTTKKKRGRPRKNPVEAPKPVELGPDGKPVKKKRGRPKGSKNRPKDEIREEKVAKAAKRSMKKRGK